MVSAREIWPAPAKINLFLHVVGKRADGYHELQTVFQFLDYGDDLRFQLNDQGRIERAYDLGFSEEVDLCLRAAKLLKAKAASEAGVTIGLTKRLPMGGGLGGGSSDAATVLIALNELWRLRLPRSELAELGLQLGADVPVFVHGRAAWAEGVGEQLTPVELMRPWYLVMCPEIEVSTARVFSNKHLTPTPQMTKIRALEKGIDSCTGIALDATFGENQLEPIVRAEYPQVDALLEWLSQFGSPRMSGSGGAVFMPVEDRHHGLRLLAQKPTDTAGFVAKGVNIHPLMNEV